MTATDAIGQEVGIGDTVMLAHTGKSAGISWTRCTVTRLTDKSFWYESPSPYAYGSVKVGDMLECGAKPLRNCIRIERANGHL
jgi:hypothetical protein